MRKTDMGLAVAVLFCSLAVIMLLIATISSALHETAIVFLSFAVAFALLQIVVSAS